MRVYLDLVILLNFIVDLLLLLGTNRLSGFPVGLPRAALGAALGGLYGGACLLKGFAFLGGGLWRLVFLALMGVIAFGWSKSGLRRCVLFALLAMALGGLAYGLGSGTFLTVAGAAAGLCAMCMIGFRGKAGAAEYVPVVLDHGSRRERLLALRDTGNTLRDPVTGETVLIVGAEVAGRLLGLTRQQLAAPVETLASGTVPGLRLIPYRAVGNSGGMLLALRLDSVQVGKEKGSRLVAFAPEGLDGEGAYQALTGGAA